jgi:multidrug efflux pump
MFAGFFIDRPVLTTMISVVIVLAGLVARRVLPIAQYPEITPPTIQVAAVYTGANARVLQDTVAAPIEQQINGVENMMYMSSQCSNDGSYNLTVTFKLGTNLDMAQVLVQNRVSQALPTLPDVVKATGVTVKKRSPSILLVVNLYSETDPGSGVAYHDQLKLSNYATIQIKDELARLEGAGDITLFGQQDYSMRIWLDPEKLAARNLTAADVVNVLKEQNVQVAAGQIGQQPVPAGLDFQYSLSTQGRLLEAEQFGAIILKSGAQGELTRLRDVGEAELGAKNLDTRSFLDGQPSVGLAIFQQPGSNALETAERVRAKMTELAQRFPAGLKHAIVYDTTPFIQESVDAVFHTLIEAGILVALVVLFFLQDWKAVILPMIDVVVSLVGTFAILWLFGFTLNNLTLFGLVLAIGIVVDDAIVVLENIERWMEQGLPPREATIKAMGEITGPIIAITLVLSSVFLPSAFLPGITGQFYQQFALTIAASMLLSAVNAMTMTPSRAVQIFAHRKPGHHHDESREALPWWGIGLLLGWLAMRFLEPRLAALVLEQAAIPQADQRATAIVWGIRLAFFGLGLLIGWFSVRPVNFVLGRFFRAFNRLFDKLTQGYGFLVGWSLRLAIIVLVVYGGLIGLTYAGLALTPTGFIPSQDKGYLIVSYQLPDSASLERTLEVNRRLEAIVRETPGVAHTVAIPGQSVILNAISSNYGTMFVVLDEFDKRRRPELYSEAIADHLRRRFFAEVMEAHALVFGPPAVDGLGNAGGFKLMLEDRGNIGFESLQAYGDQVAFEANQTPGLVGVFNSFRANTPQLYVNVDRVKCKAMGVPLTDVFTTLQVFLGGYYVNDFNKFDRTWQVNIQAEPRFRLSPSTVGQFKVRNADGAMVPLGTLLDVVDASGPVIVTRYNLYPSAALNGAIRPGTSSSQATAAMERLAGKLPPSITHEWTELTYLEKQAGGTALLAFLGAVVLVFIVLGAQYESYSMPLAVLLVVPMCILSALAGIWLARMDINIFVQVGFVVLVGLAAKNAILIVEFARERRGEGKPAFDAAVEASKVRLRPIIMTSFAFILGVVPLVVAHGAGAEMRRTLGIAVFSGMLGVTLFGIFLTPVFYYVIEWFARPRSDPSGPPPPVSAKRG